MSFAGFESCYLLDLLWLMKLSPNRRFVPYHLRVFAPEWFVNKTPLEGEGRG